jgi:hypothetical protein
LFHNPRSNFFIGKWQPYLVPNRFGQTNPSGLRINVKSLWNIFNVGFLFVETSEFVQFRPAINAPSSFFIFYENKHFHSPYSWKGLCFIPRMRQICTVEICFLKITTVHVFCKCLELHSSY